MQKKTILFSQLKELVTEKRNSRSSRIDVVPISRVLTIINNEDKKIALAVGREKTYIAKAVKLVVEALKNGGRLIYVGAGTSGRLGILDASECPPTYGTDPSMVRGIIAGGIQAVFRSQEGAEDNEPRGASDVRRLRVRRVDVVCGIAASMRTPYVLGAMREAKRRGAKVIFVTTNPRAQLLRPDFREIRKQIDVAICPVVGPEVVMGSTRMKSGTAQKMVLNMITTAAMIRLGKVYENMMVDVRMNSRKLAERAKRIIMLATDADYKTASRVLLDGNGHAKTAIVMLKCNVSAPEARKRLQEAGGFVRQAISGKSYHGR
jgi:N-acetylmuramic acid 6-phosphate etherase